MVAKKRRGQPAPAPIRPIAQRLEIVRANRGVETLLEFHERLASDVSYSSVRNWHYDRDPPISYLERVAQVFKVRLAYLVAGDGPMEEAAKAKPEGIRLAYHDLQDRLGPSYPADREAWQTIAGWWGYAVESGAIPASALDDGSIAEALAGPIEALGIPPESIPRDELQEYLLTVGAALRRVLRSISPPLPVQTGVRAGKTPTGDGEKDRP